MIPLYVALAAVLAVLVWLYWSTRNSKTGGSSVD